METKRNGRKRHHLRNETKRNETADLTKRNKSKQLKVKTTTKRNERCETKRNGSFLQEENKPLHVRDLITHMHHYALVKNFRLGLRVR